MRKLKAPRLTVKAKTGLVLLFIILLTSVLAPVLAPYDPLVSNLSEALQKPSATHLLGTEEGSELADRRDASSFKGEGIRGIEDHLHSRASGISYRTP